MKIIKINTEIVLMKSYINCVSSVPNHKVFWFRSSNFADQNNINTFLLAFIGLFAIGSAEFVYRVAPVEPIIAPAIVPSVVPSVIPTVIPETELADWEAYKTKFGKIYFNLVEDRFRRNVYFATKAKIAKFDELLSFGVSNEKLVLNSFADFTRDELFSLRSIMEEFEEEWTEFKTKYGKVYDSFEDKFRKTVYFIEKEIIEAHNKLAEAGFASYKLSINENSDLFHDELPTDANVLPSPVAPLPVARYALPYADPLTYPYAFPQTVRIARAVKPAI